jgi:hypothetical protein
LNNIDPEGLSPKGERGWSKKPSGTKDPWKHYKPHPTDPNKVIYKHPQTGKKIIKRKPPGFPSSPSMYPLIFFPDLLEEILSNPPFSPPSECKEA